MRISTPLSFAAGTLVGGAALLLAAIAPQQGAPGGYPQGGAYPQGGGNPAGTVTPNPAVNPAAQNLGPGLLTQQQIQQDTYSAMTLLNAFIGRWDVMGQAFEPDGTAAETFQGAAVFSLALGENFVLGDWTLTSGQYVLQQIDYFGYSPGLRRFTHTMLTQLDKSMVYQQGIWVPESSTLSFSMAAPLDTPSGKPRAVGLEYSFITPGQIAVTMTMQSGAKSPRTVRMMLTPSKAPPANMQPSGMPDGSIPAMATGANSMEQMQKAIMQMNSQKQAMQQYMAGMHQQMQQMQQQMMPPLNGNP
ncbi:MAG: DUF1579 family protein [Phycisphaerales bacterium]